MPGFLRKRIQSIQRYDFLQVGLAGRLRIISLDEGHNSIKIEMGPLHLRKGPYRLGVTLNGPNGVQEVYRSYKKIGIEVQGDLVGTYAYQIPEIELS
jgi:hypothetical protein